MNKAGASLPRKRLTPDAKGAFMIHEFIKRIEEGLIVNVKYSL